MTGVKINNWSEYPMTGVKINKSSGMKRRATD